MGASASTPRKLFRPWKNKLLNVEKDLLTSDLFGGICAQLTLANSQSRGSLSRRDGDAVEDDEQRLVAKKEGLLSSKLLRGLFGDVTMQCVKDVPGDSISKEAFICILALCYEGNTEDRISYIFTMYNITLTGENNNEEGHVAEKDYLYLLNYLEEYMPLPKQLYAAFEECVIPMGGLLSNSQFVAWVRKYPDVMHFLAVHLPPSQPPMNPLTIRTNEDVLAGSDPLNNSPSCRNDSNRNSFGSFDFIGGEDSGDEDSDGLYDSDQLTEMELSQSSFRDSTTSLASNDELTSILKEAGAVVQDDRTNVRAMGRSPNRDQGDQQTSTVPLTSPPKNVRGSSNPAVDASTPASRRVQTRSGHSRSRGVQKMGRYMGKAVNGGISKVGHVGRSILHVGKSQGHNQNNAVVASDTGNESDPQAADLLNAGYWFSSESQSTKKYVCGYLHKINDSKWGKKRSWHRRWFVLDRQRGVLSYYRHNPANHIPTTSSQGNIVHMADSPAPPGKGLAGSSSNEPLETKKKSFDPPARQPSTPNNTSGEEDATSNENADRVSELAAEAREPESAVPNAVIAEERPTEPEKQYLQQDQQQDQQQIQSQEQQQALLYLNESHPWYRGAMDLNMDNVSLLFERTLARNAPTRYFFQVSTLALHEMDSKRGVQYKLCADTEVDFDRWTSAIAEVVNRKDTQNAMASGGAPVLTHQQLYRQRLMEQRAAAQADQAREHESARDTDIEKHKDDADPEKTSPFYGAENEQGEQVAKASTDVSSSHSKRKAPPRIVTELPIPSSGGLPVPSCWHLHIHVDGSKQCLIVGFMLNIVAIRCLASEHVIWKIVVCIAVTGIFIFNVYNPRSLQRPIRGGLRGRISSGNNIDPSVLGTELAQCHDPDNCCLHKLGNASSNGCSDGGEGDASSAEGAGDVPHRKFSGQSMRRFAKFSMGSTMVRSDMQPDGRSSNVDHSWSTTRAETFSVRSADYKKLRRKEASQPALFEFLGADLVRTDSKVDLISQRVEFPPEYENAKLFIINAQLPSYGPSVWGDGSCDGPGYSLALYWMIPDDVYEELQNPTTTTLRLLKRFLEAGDDRSLTDRFKVIAQVTNQDECGMTGMAKKLLVSHNATPVLTRPQHRIYHFREGSTEVVVDVHAFSYIARRGIHLLIDKTSKLVIDVAFVIQGETEDELPEQVLGCCRLDHTSVQKAAELP